MVTQTYKYRPVSTEYLETHLLTLYPAGLYSDDIRIHLAKARLSVPDNELTEYDALSYAWGDPSMTHAVDVMDGEGEDDDWPGGVLPITGNMDMALRCVRHQQQPRVLWIDALCINQSNLQERSHQVQRMDQVYRKARRVIVFLGAESDDDVQAVDMLTSIGASLNIEGSSLNPWMQIISPPHPQNPQHAAESPAGHTATSEYIEHDGVRALALKMSMPAVLAALKLVSRPWFSRVWVIQEVRTMADPDASIMQYGTRAVPWEHFRKGVCAFYHVNKADMDCQEAVLAMQTYLLNMTRTLCYRERKLSVTEFLSLQHFHCADPRDRIYGVLSLLGGELGYPLAVDYHVPTEVVFENFQRQELQVRGLWQLPLCHLDPDSGWDAPSWVPNQLSFPSHLQEIKEVPTYRFTTEVGFVSDRCLRVYGCHVATIRTVVRCPPLVEHWSPDGGAVSLIAWCQQVAYRLCGETWPPPPPTNSEDAGLQKRKQKQLADMIIGLCDIRGDYKETHIRDGSSDGFLHRGHIKTLILEIFAMPPLVPESLVNSDQMQRVVASLSPVLILFLFALYVNLCRAFGYSSRPVVFATDAGEAGYGPGSALPGDQVCTIFGCKANLLLRPVSDDNYTDSNDNHTNKDEEYAIVGPVSLASNIRSEKVLGPLPRHIYLALDRERNLHTFWDTRTGAKVHDPRLAALGLGEAAEKLEGTYIQANNFNMSAEELRQHGIDVKPFFLV